jgi:hypothetical protein
MAFIKKRPFLALCVALLTIVFVVSSTHWTMKIPSKFRITLYGLVTNCI